MDPAGQPVRLRYGVSLLRRRQTVVLVLALVAVPLAAVAAVAAILALHAEEPATVPGLLLENLREVIADDPSLVIGFWLMPPLAIATGVMLLAQRAAWLRIGPGGIEGYLPRHMGFGLTGQTVGRWQVSRDRIRAVRLLLPRGGTGRLERRLAKVQRIRACRLEIETDRESIRLGPFPWYRPDGADHRLGLRELSALSDADMASHIERTPIVESLRARGITIESVPGDAAGDAAEATPPGFDLAGDRGMVAQLVLLFGAGLYALIDTFFLLQYTPLAPMPRAPFAVMLLAAIPLTVWLGRRAPHAERIVVSALTVAALAVAVYPGLLRFNAMTAEPLVLEYIPTAPGQFRPAAGEYPAIDLSDRNLAEYWAQRGPEASHPFTLRRGDAGFWQLDLAPLRERTRAFYGAREQ